MSTPLVSVIMPVHNAAPFVAAAIQSVLAQTVRDLELLIVDDASTDDSAQVIAAQSDPRIHYQRSDIPLNAAGSRNLALAQARGGFIAFLDADDLAAPDRFEVQLAALADVDIAASLITTIDEQGKSHGRGFVKPRESGQIPAVLLFENCLALSSITARKSVLQPFRPELAPAEDYDLWARLAMETKMRIVPRELTQYRLHANSVSVRQPEKMRVAVDAIHASQLERLGVTPSPIHAQSIAATMDQLMEADQWLRKLKETNDRTAIYPQPIFREVLRERWFAICLDSWQLGWPVWRTFHKSPLAAPTLLQRASLFRRVFGR